MSTPQAILPQATPFEPWWWSVDLGAHRPCASTYCAYPLASLPPLDERLFQGDFAWLSASSTAGQVNFYDDAATLRDHLARLQTQAAASGLPLPAAFSTFMSTPAWHRQLPSCTDCYFDLAADLVRSPFPAADGYFIRFLNDSQDVLLWYLYVQPSGAHCVVVSPIRFDDDEPFGGEPLAIIQRHTHYCAPHFEAFLYRYWLENQIWFGQEGAPLPPAAAAYLQHYARHDPYS